MPYDTSQFSPGYGGKINSAGNVVNMADCFDTSTNSLKVETVPATNMSGLLTFQSGAVAIGNGTPQDVSGYATLSLDVVISATATVTFEVSNDGTNYTSIPYMTTSGSNSSLASTARNLRFSVSGSKWFRARVSAFTSGTVDVIGYASTTNNVVPTTIGTFGNSDSNSASQAGLMGVGGFNLLYDGTNWVRQRSTNTTDGLANQSNLSSTAGFLMGFNGTTWDRVRTAADGMTTGVLATQNVLWSGTAYNRQSAASNIGDGHGGAAASPSVNYLWNGTNFDRLRAGKVYKYIEYLNLTDNTATTVWTPASGKKFRLMAVQISSSGASLLHLRDGAGGTVFHTQRTAGIDSKYFEFGNGYLSAAANNVLEILNKSTATINVWVTAWGTEE
jgi:hypothetical protein